MGRVKATLLAIVMLVAIVILSIAASFVHNQMLLSAETENPDPASLPSFGVQGLPYGRSLASEPFKVTDRYIFFDDRIVEHLHHNRDAITYTQEALSNTFSSVPEGVNPYLMIVPMRVAVEDGFEEFSGDMLDTIAEIYGMMPNRVTTFNLLTTFHQHREEYIFFRTDNSWTALGAYYAARLFCESKGIQMKDISEYFEYYKEYTTGSYADNLEEGLYLKKIPDYISYYLSRDVTNWQTSTIRKGSGEYKTFEAPTIALSRGATDIFIAGNFSHSILEGDGNNGKTLLIIGDSEATFFAPWLTPYYENVYLISMSRYQNGSEGFQQIFEDYHVTDFILLESYTKFGRTAENGRLRSFTTPEVE